MEFIFKNNYAPPMGPHGPEMRIKLGPINNKTSFTLYLYFFNNYTQLQQNLILSYLLNMKLYYI